MAAAALILSIIASAFTISKDAYELRTDVRAQQVGASVPVARQVIDMTPVETNLSLNGR